MVLPTAFPARNKPSFFCFVEAIFSLLCCFNYSTRAVRGREHRGQYPPGIFLIIIFKILVILLNQLILRLRMNKKILIKQVNCSFGILVFVRGIMPIETMQSPDCITYAQEIHHGR